MTTKQAQNAALLNQILTTTGCDKPTVIGLVLIAVKGFINEGLTASQALDLVCRHSPASHHILELRARVEALEAASSHQQHGKAAEHAEPDPAASLVDRVAQIIATFASEGLLGDNATPAACAAIREVAAWLQSNYPEKYGSANLLNNEANQ